MPFSKKKYPLNYEQAINYTLRLLRQRNYSEHNLRQKLTLRATEPDTIDQVMNRLKEWNLVNDQRYTESIIRTESTYRHASPRAIAQKLYHKGIDKELIEERLKSDNQALPNEVERASYHIGRFLTRNKINASDLTKTPELKNKLFASLARKGFGYSTITEAFQSCLHNHGNSL